MSPLPLYIILVLQFHSTFSTMNLILQPDPVPVPVPVPRDVRVRHGRVPVLDEGGKRKRRRWRWRTRSKVHPVLSNTISKRRTGKTLIQQLNGSSNLLQFISPVGLALLSDLTFAFNSLLNFVLLNLPFPVSPLPSFVICVLGRCAASARPRTTGRPRQSCTTSGSRTGRPQRPG
jgi:hypothetical protein